jgi:hypothetical protein
MIKTIGALLVLGISAYAQTQPPGEQLRPDWNTGYYPGVVTLSDGRTATISVHVFGRQDVEKAQSFGRHLVGYHDSQAEVEAMMTNEGRRRYGNSMFAQYFIFEAKMGFSLEVRERKAAMQ